MSLLSQFDFPACENGGKHEAGIQLRHCHPFQSTYRKKNKTQKNKNRVVMLMHLMDFVFWNLSKVHANQQVTVNPNVCSHGDPRNIFLLDNYSHRGWGTTETRKPWHRLCFSGFWNGPCWVSRVCLRTESSPLPVCVQPTGAESGFHIFSGEKPK